VVDDEAFIRETVRTTLETHGYRVLTAGDGEEALVLYRQHRSAIKAVLLDLMMPVMNGPAALAALQELDPQVRIIATSGLRPTGRVAEAVAAGQTAFLKKPYTEEQLLRALATVMTR
jgi:CheY-like chemotaxis protein